MYSAVIVVIMIGLLQLVYSVTDSQKQMLINAFWDTNIFNTLWTDISEHECNWVGVVCSNQTVIRIMLIKRQIDGYVHFNELPNSMIDINLQNNRLKGELDLTTLPINLRYLNVRFNSFYGKVNLAECSMSLIVLDVRWNYLWGPFGVVPMDDETKPEIFILCFPQWKYRRIPSSFENWLDQLDENVV
eukprot:UN06335